ncbi:hypothetical protein V8Z74_06075 [Comamonas sp. w2-DMI]|uniref:hypothetical protein n=1 Tax=Comamonas sp. w2-DMI TaxID=3126391 RepID=UPI0032E3B1E4
MLILLGLACAESFHTQGLGIASIAILGAGLWIAFRRKTFAGLPNIGLQDVAWWEWLALLGSAIAVMMMAWRFPGHWDDTAYHLPLARTIVEHQGLVANEWLRFPYFPAYAQLLFAAGLLLDASLAQWLATWPVVMTLLGLMGASRWLAGHAVWGCVAWSLYVSRPMVSQILGFAYVDETLALLCMAALLAAAVWVQSEASNRQRWLILAGMFAGLAGGVKLHGVVAAAAIGLGVLCFSGSVRQALRNGWWYGLCCVLVAGFWYLRSYWVTGDPIHPAGGRFFGFYLWTPQDLANQMAEQATHGVPRHWVNFGAALAQVEVLFLLALFALPLFRFWRKPVWKLIWLVLLVLLLFWFWTSQVDRYLMPVLPLGSLAVLMLLKESLTWLQRRWQLQEWQISLVGLASSTSALLVTGHFLWTAWSDFRDRPSMQAQQQARSEVVLLQHAAELRAQFGNRILNFGYENAVFHYTGQLIGDWFGIASFFRAAECSVGCELNSVQKVEHVMRTLDAPMVLIHSKRFRFNEAEFSSRFKLLEKRGDAYLYSLPEQATQAADSPVLAPG